MCEVTTDRTLNTLVLVLVSFFVLLRLFVCLFIGWVGRWTCWVAWKPSLDVALDFQVLELKMPVLG